MLHLKRRRRLMRSALLKLNAKGKRYSRLKSARQQSLKLSVSAKSRKPFDVLVGKKERMRLWRKLTGKPWRLS